MGKKKERVPAGKVYLRLLGIALAITFMAAVQSHGNLLVVASVGLLTIIVIPAGILWFFIKLAKSRYF